MPLTKKEYIGLHSGKLLAERLSANDWPDECPIKLVVGNDSTNPKSALAKALVGTSGEYVVGHRASRRPTDGHVIAVKL